MNPESLELQIERAHEMLAYTAYPVYLGSGGISIGQAPFGSTLVGYYRHGISLAHFREDVFAEHDRRLGR